MLLEDALAALEAADSLFLTRRALGADPRWAMPFDTITDKALTALFTETMFRPIPEAGFGPVFRERPFTLLAHYNELDWAESCGVSRYLIQISVGLEEPEDLWQRLNRALGSQSHSQHLGEKTGGQTCNKSHASTPATIVILGKEANHEPHRRCLS